MNYAATKRLCGGGKISSRQPLLFTILTLESIHGQSKSLEETEEVSKHFLPTTEDQDKTFRAGYAVHKIDESMDRSIENVPQSPKPQGNLSKFIGMVTMVSLEPSSLVLPETLVLPTAAEVDTLSIELAYMFLPRAWGKGYATESVQAVLEACRRAPSYWAPFSKLYVRAIVNGCNAPSLRVMEKIGMTKHGVYHLTGRNVFIAGEWRDEHRLHIYGMLLLN